MDKHLHIISLTVPYPVNYGGVYDLFYKLEALHATGIKIHLHCFDYGRGPQPALEQYCEDVKYYTRNSGYRAFSTTLPYIVNSRKNESLFNNLLQDAHPILMEGIHCSYLLQDKRFANRKTAVRLHNVEHLYYQSLRSASHSIVDKLYYSFESRLLKKYEQGIAQSNTIFLTVNPGDGDIYKAVFHASNTSYLPLFLPPSWQVQCQPGMGAYCLYHGDLSVEMNEKAAAWLIKMFSTLKIPLVIAGKSPGKKLHSMAHGKEGICIVADPVLGAMQEMIAKAHINILPSFSNTGIKIKLLNALFNGRHCVVNQPTVFGTGLEELCHVTDTEEGMRQRIEALYHQPYLEQENEVRKAWLEKIFCNAYNAKKLAGVFWPGEFE